MSYPEDKLRDEQLAEFIEKNRSDLVECIVAAGGRRADCDDEEIEMWIINDSGLYNWALDEGVEL